MRAYTHGGWAHRQRVSITFWLGKTQRFSCAPDPRPLDLHSNAITTEPIRHTIAEYNKKSNAKKMRRKKKILFRTEELYIDSAYSRHTLLQTRISVPDGSGNLELRQIKLCVWTRIQNITIHFNWAWGKLAIGVFFPCGAQRILPASSTHETNTNRYTALACSIRYSLVTLSL